MTWHVAGGTFARHLPGGYDYSFRWNGERWKRVAIRPLGELRTATKAASRIYADEAFTLRKTICLRVKTEFVLGRRCWRKYAVENEADPDRDFAVWWETGSTHARAGATLGRLRDRVRGLGEETEIVNWQPTGTYQVSRCRRAALMLAPVPLGSQFTTCKGTWGLLDIRRASLDFGWMGRRRAGAWIGIGGGAEFGFAPGGPLRVRLGFRQAYCLRTDPDC